MSFLRDVFILRNENFYLFCLPQEYHIHNGRISNKAIIRRSKELHLLKSIDSLELLPTTVYRQNQNADYLKCNQDLPLLKELTTQ